MKFYFFLPQPPPRIHKDLDPWRHFVVLVLGGVVRPVPWVDAAFGVGHHGQVAAVCAAHTGNTAWGAVGVGGVGVVAVL